MKKVYNDYAWINFCCNKEPVLLEANSQKQDNKIMASLIKYLGNNRHSDIPIAACIIDEKGTLLAIAQNETLAYHDPSAHAEITAIRMAGKAINNHRLINTSLYVTHEPCPMCFYAILQARIKRIIFGSYDQKIGILSQNIYTHLHNKTNHHFSWTGGVMHKTCSVLLHDFFQPKR